ncbi:translation initiation factor, putative [Ichthyophthirius multifiliis]|uniref:Translation initiation factor, putative n=1 Tax=Ichthyophthirius multifiliis TaxID=5932 RepID=G0QJZ4_ICHMU|nr:translation initiation factor, putative [Ichthyophthirius multifiliis]EGR34454.1 translation initiation factor, putative [Ichthyophthirius multifiliis]|eukprot:XP_004039758.1 translation initiation factor, putative [Ichthyophthirius multifiliis]
MSLQIPLTYEVAIEELKKRENLIASLKSGIGTPRGQIDISSSLKQSSIGQQKQASENYIILQKTNRSNISNFLLLKILFQFKNDNNTDFRIVEGISIFKEHIQPLWEHEENKNGCMIQCKFVDINQDLIDNIFFKILTTVLSDEFKFYEQTNGFRFSDKGNVKKSSIRLEIWFNFAENNVIKDDVQKYFEDILNEFWNNPTIIWRNFK